MLPLGIGEIKVSRVIRIHNRFLRNQFDEKTEAFQDFEEFDYRKCLEYLFYAEDPAQKNEAHNVMLNGFRP